MKDSDLMPFGTHKDTPIGQVPADYLLYIYEQPWIGKWPAVAKYIEANKKWLRQECEESSEVEKWSGESSEDLIDYLHKKGL